MGESREHAGSLLSAKVTENTRCLGCGYQLLSLPINSVCPECARSVRSTIEELDALGSSGKQARWMLGGLSILTVLSFLAFVTYVGSTMFTIDAIWPVESRAIGACVAGVLSALQSVVIYRLLQTIRKHSVYSVFRIGIEGPVRWMLVTSVVKATGIVSEGIYRLTQTTIDNRILLLLIVVIGCGVVASMHAKMRMVVRLQELTGNAKRARAARLRTWGIPLLMGMLLSLSFINWNFAYILMFAIPFVAISYWYVLAFGAVSLHRPMHKN